MATEAGQIFYFLFFFFFTLNVRQQVFHSISFISLHELQPDRFSKLPISQQSQRAITYSSSLQG